MKLAVLGLALFALCTAARAATCPVHGERPMIEAQLFFGRDIEGRGPVTDEEWSDFAAKVIAEDFPAGFTVTNGQGAWFDSKARSMIHEDSKIVLVAAAQSPDTAAKLSHMMDAYKRQFHQQSVGLITRQVCAAF
ncbi:MAG TPA: DUF3574 domain-containing protein [Rhizomicrobium sp.]|nr:DUF3574 domain-containing protein [Rhizomicrobium sp.]